MQYQSPENNNPANPLIKVAAFDIERQYPRTKDLNYIAVLASLNFKRSSHMSGLARTTDGLDVSVSFKLAIRKASLEIEFYEETPTSFGKFVDITGVAFSENLAVKNDYSKFIQDTSSTEKSLSLSGAIKSSMDKAGLLPTTRANAEGSRIDKVSSKSEIKQNFCFDQSNINVTYAGNGVYWEFNSKTAAIGHQNRDEYLDGEVFYQTSADKKRTACYVKRKRRTNSGALEIRGSVYTALSDLIIDDVCFIDELGNKIPWTLIESPYPSKALDVIKAVANSRPLKESLMKSVIKKHLVSQGLSTKGAMVEICRANT